MKIIEKKTLFQGPKFHFASHLLRTSSGSEISREFIDHPGSVVLLPILDDGRVALIQNYRHSLDRVILELPAGTMFWGEQPEVTARRELTEETGFGARRWTKLCDFWIAPGLTNERMHLFLAEELSAGPPRPEEDEEMTVRPTALAEALRMIEDGGIADAKSMIGLWRLARLRGVEVPFAGR